MSTGRSYVPERPDSVILDMRRLARIRLIDQINRYVVVEAGCTWEGLHAGLPKGWTCETRAPLSGNVSTIGGALAHGFPGGLKGVLGVEVVLADGSLARTGSWGRNGAEVPYYREYGPDLTGLFVGDTGSFGIKTAVSLHLVSTAGARATASFGYERFEDVAATLVELAPMDVLTTRFCFDPYDTENLSKVALAEGASVLAKVVRSGKGLRGQLSDGFSLVKGAWSGMPRGLWSLNLVAEQFTQDGADAAITAASRICLQRGRKIPNVLALASAAPVYSVRRFLGAQGERWIATHAIFSIGRAVEVACRTEQFFDERKAEIARHGMRIGCLAQVTPVHFQVEPLFYWPDELEDIHFRHLTPAEAARFRAFERVPGVREFVQTLRSDLRDLYEELGAIHVHLSKFFRYAEVLTPDTRALLARVKTALDAEGRMNPGNLGLGPGRIGTPPA